MNLSDLSLPPDVHATILSGTDLVTGGQIARLVIWSDRPYDHCPWVTCGQAIDVRVPCPVVLNLGAGRGGRLEETDQTHCCGEWMPVGWEEVPITGADVVDVPDAEAAARRLSAERAQDIKEDRSARVEELIWTLRETLDSLACPLGPGETIEDRESLLLQGTDITPGVYRHGDELRAWMPGPIDDGDPLIVTDSSIVS